MEMNGRYAIFVSREKPSRRAERREQVIEMNHDKHVRERVQFETKRNKQEMKRNERVRGRERERKGEMENERIVEWRGERK